MSTIFWWIVIPPIGMFLFQIFAYGTYYCAVLEIRYNILKNILQARSPPSHGSHRSLESRIHTVYVNKNVAKKKEKRKKHDGHGEIPVLQSSSVLSN